MRTTALLVLIASVATACAAATPSASVDDTGQPSPSASATPGPSASPSDTPDPTPASAEPSTPPPSPATPSTSAPPQPTPPSDLARIVVKERDDIRVEVELQRNPLPAGEPSWVKVRVTNEGRTDVTWFHDGCADPVYLTGISRPTWPMGEEHSQQLDLFKAYALGGSIAAAPSPHGSLALVPKEFLHTGPIGCDDVGISETIKPGETIRATHWWSGFTTENRALPLAGAATIRAFADYYWRGKEPTDITKQAIRLKLDAWIDSDTAAERLSPAQAVDAALTDRDFVQYLGTQQIANGREEIAWYDADRDVWEIGVMPWYETDPPRIHGVLVDAVTGAIRGPLDRAWDQDVDPFP
jgi:hypothetical protein